jgi:purine-binding chemotaxis protein CheW
MAALAADARTAAILKRRADELARVPQTQDSPVREPFLHFRLGHGREYGVRHAAVEGVLAVPSITHVPCAPPAIAGLINRHGQLLPVLDLQKFFGLGFEADGEAPGNTACDIIVIHAVGIDAGIRVDELLGISEYRPDALTSALPSQGHLDRGHVLGLLDGRIAILNIEMILGDLAADEKRHAEAPGE